MKTLSVKLDDDLSRKLDFIIDKRRVADKSSYIRQILNESLTNEIIDFLCQCVQKKEMTPWRAAELADISLRKMLDELTKRNIITYTEEDFQHDLKIAYSP
jgi:predicted HTH domain antitoxin